MWAIDIGANTCSIAEHSVGPNEAVLQPEPEPELELEPEPELALVPITLALALPGMRGVAHACSAGSTVERIEGQ